jgi:nicotinate-nucleotide adenylyltransferase
VKLAMLGGSFNPVHNGHVALARAVRDQLGYDRVVLVPANISPGKQTGYVAEGKHRLTMLRLAASVEPGLCADDCELVRGGVSWSIDTLRYLSERYGKDLTAPIGLIIGQDLAASFGNWKEAAVIARDYTLLLAVRPPWKDETFSFPHVTVENPPIAVSSSAIRSAIHSGGPWRSLVPEPVGRYIEEHGLYAS